MYEYATEPEPVHVALPVVVIGVNETLPEIVPPTFRLPAIPTPPATSKAPVEVEDEAVVIVVEITPDEVIAPELTAPAIPAPPSTSKAPVEVEDDAVVRGILAYDYKHSMLYTLIHRFLQY